MNAEEWRGGNLGHTGAREPRVIFGQVHEDAEVEVEVARHVPTDTNWFAIASAGCTALSLLALAPKRLDAVDINPAQVALLELKARVLERVEGTILARTFEVDGSAAVPLTESLSLASRGYWSRHQRSLRRGLQHCGLLDDRLRMALQLFRLAVHPQSRIEAMLSQNDGPARLDFFQRHWRTWRWKAAFDLLFHPLILRAIYGMGFIKKLPPDAARTIRQSLEDSLLGSPPAENPYLWQTFLGRYPADPNARPSFLQPHRLRAVRASLGALNPNAAEAAQWFRSREDREYGFYALSNILELVSEREATELAEQIVRTAAPGALVVTRAIFPQATPAFAHPAIVVDEDLTRAVGAVDRTPICRGVRVFRVGGSDR